MKRINVDEMTPQQIVSHIEKNLADRTLGEICRQDFEHTDGRRVQQNVILYRIRYAELPAVIEYEPLSRKGEASPKGRLVRYGRPS